MKIGILQAGHMPAELKEKHGDYDVLYADMLAGHGFEFVAWPVVDGEFPARTTDADGWLIGGSKHGVYDPLPFISRLETFVREAYSDGVPVAGICFGHQVIAQALGGTVEKYSGGWDVGHRNYQMGGEKIRAAAFHQDQVIDPPGDAEVIASTPFCKFAGLAYKGAALSFQPHPEFSPPVLKALIGFRQGISFDAETANAALESLSEKDDANRIADQIAAFFKENAAKRAA